MADGYRFIATPTMRDFMLDPSYVRVLAGAIGGGKTVACIHELIRWATTQAPDTQGRRRTRFLLVRNTSDQLRSTTLKTIADWFPPTVYGKWIATDKTLQYKFSLADKTTVETEWMLIALDTPDDVRKALSLECTGLFGNECRELHPEVVDGLLMRVNRFPSMKDGGATRGGALFDTNMPGADTWWSDKMENPPENWSVFTQPPAVLPIQEYLETYKDEPDPFLVAKDALGAEYVINPAADNLKNLAKDYYQQTLSGKSEDFINVYLRCQFGRTLSGLPVFDQTFRASTHVAKTPYTAIRSDNYPLCIGMDMGRTPAAVIMQATPMGQIVVLSEVVTEASNSMGMQTFLKTVLVPHLNQHYPGMARYVAPDPAGWQRSQGNEKAPVDYIREAGFTVVRPQTNKTSLRLEVIDKALGQAADARPRFQINPGCKTLIKAFRGAYKWAVNKKGDLTNESEPIKSHPHSDVVDACGYALLVIDGGHAGSRNVKRREVVKAQAGGWT